MIGSPSAFSLPFFNFLNRNNKSEPMTNRQKVRIILFWWSRGESNPYFYIKKSAYSLMFFNFIAIFCCH